MGKTHPLQGAFSGKAESSDQIANLAFERDVQNRMWQMQEEYDYAVEKEAERRMKKSRDRLYEVDENGKLREKQTA